MADLGSGSGGGDEKARRVRSLLSSYYGSNGGGGGEGGGEYGSWVSPFTLNPSPYCIISLCPAPCTRTLFDHVPYTLLYTLDPARQTLLPTLSAPNSRP
jgi:hypothetical protein